MNAIIYYAIDDEIKFQIIEADDMKRNGEIYEFYKSGKLVGVCSSVISAFIGEKK